MSDDAIKPYAGTSGWSGSSASEERARRDDGDGTTSARQNRVLAALERAGADGMTWNEVGALFGMHHGTASGALSVLHKAGRIARLAERRHRCQVYVALGHVNGRETQQHGTKKRDERERLYKAFEAGFRLGIEDTEAWTDVAIRALFDNWQAFREREQSSE